MQTWRIADETDQCKMILVCSVMLSMMERSRECTCTPRQNHDDDDDDDDDEGTVWRVQTTV